MGDEHINFGSERNRRAYERMTPDQKAAVDRVRAKNRTPEKRATDAAVRQVVREEFPPLVPDERLLTLVATLRMERERQGLSLNDVCEQTGLALSTVSRLELGKVPNPTYETLRAYASVLGLELEITATGAGRTAGT